MSRNLCRTNCWYCHGPVVLIEPERPITHEDTKAYYDEHADMKVANAQCDHCEAKYLAWVRCPGAFGHIGQLPGPCGFVDLSFRSSFNDEPGDEDVPRWLVETIVVRTRRPWSGWTEANRRQINYKPIRREINVWGQPTVVGPGEDE